MYYPGLVVLDKSPSFLAANIADVHLNSTIVSIAKIISTAAIRTKPDAVVRMVNMKGVKQYICMEQKLLGPTKDKDLMQWVEWCSMEYNRVWWLVTISWMCSKELRSRFGSDDHPMHHRIQDWVSNGVTRLFPKNGIKMWSFPLVLPEKPAMLGMQEADCIMQYRDFYKTLQSKDRMRWTAREKPWWISGDKQPSIKILPCTTCGSDAGFEFCSNLDCPRKVTS